MQERHSSIKTYSIGRGSAAVIPKKPRAVALGIFDGIHIGHRAVILRAAGAEIPNVEHVTSAVFTFTQPPWALMKASAWELTSHEQKETVLEGLGIEEWIQIDFNAIRNLTPEEFVRDFLHEKLDARRVCCGFNYHFGKSGAGNAETLIKLCEPLGIEVKVVPAVMVDGQPVSASLIRRLIASGNMKEAAKLLGRPFTIDFEVAGGRKLGRLLGTPTINQPLPAHFVRPRYGVYATSVEVDGHVTHGVTNVGIRPTVGSDGPLAETWIADFDGDLYGQRVPVSLIKFLRPEQKFASVEELKKQILKDEKEARRAIMGDASDGIRAVLFDFDDTLQNRPKAFLKFCSYFMAKYFPTLPPDEAKKRSLEMLRRNSGGYVDYIDYFSSLFAEWGWKDAPSAEDIYLEFQFRFAEDVSLFPETVGVIQALKSRGFLVGVVTNGTSLQQNRKLDLCGLRPLLDIAVVSGDEGIRKPDPEIFRRAAARLGVACESCCYVGDHTVNDVQGSRAAGMHPVYINPYGSDVHPENVPEIHNLKELLDLV